MCDELQGGTPGLYGLCVAFCEAQDAASVDQPITEEDYDALLASAPHGRILENYNKKKKDSDPEMPCINVVDPCPCAIEGQFQKIGQGDTHNRAYCIDHMNDAPNSSYNTSGLDDHGYYNPNRREYLYAYEMYRSDYVQRYGNYFCQALKIDYDVGEYIYVPGFNITAEEAEACRALAVDTAAANGVACN